MKFVKIALFSIIAAGTFNGVHASTEAEQWKFIETELVQKGSATLPGKIVQGIIYGAIATGTIQAGCATVGFGYNTLTNNPKGNSTDFCMNKKYSIATTLIIAALITAFGKSSFFAPFVLQSFLKNWYLHKEKTPESLRPYFDALKTSYEQSEEKWQYLVRIAPECIDYVKAQVDEHKIENTVNNVTF
jgi:hypothetical protein